MGAVFPISGGLLQAAGLHEDLLAGDIVIAEGRGEFTAAIDDFEHGAHNETRLLDILCCQGCATGVGLTQRRTPACSAAPTSASTPSTACTTFDFSRLEAATWSASPRWT